MHDCVQLYQRKKLLAIAINTILLCDKNSTILCKNNVIHFNSCLANKDE